ncbi:MAG: hypothetical protein OEZ08_03490, partial [Betaproteobacteria bacterium]|nr:hypothetical protein [Betaproteobacteria bacterium]
ARLARSNEPPSVESRHNFSNRLTRKEDSIVVEPRKSMEGPPAHRGILGLNDWVGRALKPRSYIVKQRVCWQSDGCHAQQ